MSDVPGVSPGAEWRGPHGAGEEWLSFEHRMRRRRAAKCLLRADLAIDDGNIEEARTALREARELDPDSAAEIEALEERLTEVAAAQESPAVGGPRRQLFRIRPLTAVYGAGFLLLAAGAVAFGRPYLTRTAAPSDASRVAAAVEPAVPAVDPAQSHPTGKGKLEVIYETVRVKEATPRVVEDLPRLPSSTTRPIADAEEEPVVMAVNRGAPAPPEVPPAPEVRSELTVSTPPVTVAAPPPPPEPTPSEPIASEPPPPPAPDESAIVRAVLRRYERAYSSLDASEASAVWPGVNKTALARAFEGLASQRVSLGSCDVNVNGPAARATCAGSATWEPKVGGGVRTEPRLWNFELRKSGDSWRIERAITQGH